PTRPAPASGSAASTSAARRWRPRRSTPTSSSADRPAHRPAGEADRSRVRLGVRSLSAMSTAGWSVTPSGPLRGDVPLRGSKNAVTKHLVAAVLGAGTSTIRQVPEVGDVAITADTLRSLGVGVDHDEAAGVITVEPHD